MATEIPTIRTSTDQLNTILAEIADHACEPNFSAQGLAGRLRLSDRYIRQLLKRSGKTFSQHKSERRLDRVRLLLLSPSSAHLSITEISLMSGFNDVSHFNRSFGADMGKRRAKRGEKTRPRSAAGGQVSLRVAALPLNTPA